MRDRYQVNSLWVMGLLVLVGCAGPQAVSINTRPPGALVTINGEAKGYTPLEVELQGHRSYRMQVEKPGYAPFARTLTEQAGTTQYGPFILQESRLEPNVQIDLRPVP